MLMLNTRKLMNMVGRREAVTKILSECAIIDHPTLESGPCPVEKSRLASHVTVYEVINEEGFLAL